MAFTTIFVALLSLGLPSLATSLNPCPFNSQVCTCSDSSNPTDFDYASCISTNLLVPSFSGNATYTIYDQLDLTFSAFNIPPRSFVAFKKIGILNLTQPEGASSVQQQWSPNAFYGTQINGLAVSNVAGVLPPPTPLTDVANTLESYQVFNCRQAVRLPANGFSKFSKLTILLIQDTTISSIDDQAFGGLTNLGEIWLINAALDTFPAEALKKLTTLYRIDLTNSHVKNFNKTDFAPFTELIFLILDGNDIQAAIDSGALVNIPNTVTTLFLRASEPPLASVPSTVIAAAPQVTVLSLAHNQISALKNGDFPKNTEIISLDLSYNPISSVDLGAFQNLINVYNLNLAGHKVSSFDFTLLSGMDYLLTLDVSDSKELTSLNVTNIKMVPHTLQVINAKSTSLAVIDPQLDEILSQKRFRTLDISNIRTINCDSNVAWMAKYALCQPARIWAPDTRCSNGSSFVDFLAGLVDSPCSTQISTSQAMTSSIPVASTSTGAVPPATSSGAPGTTAASGTTGTAGQVTTTASGTTGTWGPTTTKAASSFSANLGLMFAMGAAIALVKAI